MKEQLKNKLKKGYTIKIYNNIHVNNEYINNEYIKINLKSSAFKSSDGKVYIIKKELCKVINDIIENTFYNKNNFKLVFYRDYKIKNTIIIKFNTYL